MYKRMGAVGALLALTVAVGDEARAQWPPTLDASQLDASIVGDSADIFLGGSTAILHQPSLQNCDGGGVADDDVADFNDDGLADVAVSAVGADLGAEEAGAVLVYFGRLTWATGLTPDDADLVLVGEEEFDEAGRSLTAGDVNGDCVTDLIIGAPGHDLLTGRVYVIFGGSDVGETSPRNLSTADLIIDGGKPFDELGASMAAGLDITGDGLGDLLLGAPGDDGPTASYSDAGRAYLLPGRASWGSGAKDVAAVASVRWYGSNPNEALGTALAMVPDFDGGGGADLLLSSPEGPAGGNVDAGKIYLLAGEGQGGWASDANVQNVADGVIRGLAVSYNAGETLAVVGDVSGDGLSDVLIGAPGGGGGNGVSWLIFGEESLPLGSVFIDDMGGVPLTGELAGSEAVSVAPAGDVNGDSLADLLVGSAGYSPSGPTGLQGFGRAYLVYGRDSGWGDVSLAAADVSFDGELPGQRLGESVSGGGDIDGDGEPDFLLGSSLADPGGISDAGAVYLARSGLFGDVDGDTYTPFQGDCDDGDGSVYPGAPDGFCDGIDQDCDGQDFGDLDGDGYGACEYQIGDADYDCDDDDSTTYPGAAEVCEGADNDCDSSVDEGALLTFYADSDDDGYGTSSSTQLACDVPSGYSDNFDDCDDGEADVNPDGVETCDGRDEDCDTRVDEGTLTIFYVDIDEDGYGVDEREFCELIDGYAEAGGDCDDGDAAINPGATEICGDDVDEDCSGALSDLDVDGDGYVDIACADYIGQNGGDCDDGDPDRSPGLPEICGDGIDNDCTGAEDDAEQDADGDSYITALCGGDDCDDTDRTVNPGRPEVCGDAIDNDCSGVADDLDGDGDGAISGACGGDDCDDSDDGRSPDLEEIVCDGIDQDCSGLDLTDDDGDGYPACGVGLLDCDDTDPGRSPGTTEVACDDFDQDCDDVDLTDVDRDGYDGCGEAPEDCDDAAPQVNPEGTEVAYDGIDQDCDGEDLTDVDGDGYDGGADDAEDCDDEDAGIYPGATDIPYDGIDQDCDGGDLKDVDGDGHDAAQVGGGDCLDQDASSYPGAYEIPDDLTDNNCDGELDNYAADYDHDGDGYTEVDDPADCEPLNGDVSPGQEEIIGNGIDDDCDGHVDEPDAPVGYVEAQGCSCGGAEGDATQSAAFVFALFSVLGLRLRRRRS